MNAITIDYQGQRAIGEMSHAMTQRAGLFLVRIDPAGAEVHSAVVAVLFGLVLLLQADTFGRSPAYRSLSEIGPQALWGAIWLMVGLGHVLGVVLDALTGIWRVRQAATFMATALWVWWLWSLWSSIGVTTATTTYAVVMAGSGWGWLRAGR